MTKSIDFFKKDNFYRLHRDQLTSDDIFDFFICLKHTHTHTHTYLLLIHLYTGQEERKEGRKDGMMDE